MEPLKNDSFGLLIAYVLPGFVALSATAFFSETVRSWLGASSSFSPSVGGFLYVTLASTALGLLISTIRWAVIDRLHHATGIREPKWDFSTLQRNFAAFEGLVQSHYRYYQFYANTLVALWFWTLNVRLTGAGRDRLCRRADERSCARCGRGSMAWRSVGPGSIRRHLRPAGARMF